MVTSTEWRGILHIYDAYRVWASAQKDPGEGLPMNDAEDIEGFLVGFRLFVFLTFSICVWYDREWCTKVLNSVGGNGC